ncbi:hypothetical protein Ddc_05556 [Ditylenchus destructor]|nr:hypothetical protein Ddc_05556 [Ditylenchus destructor]
MTTLLSGRDFSQESTNIVQEKSRAVSNAAITARVQELDSNRDSDDSNLERKRPILHDVIIDSGGPYPVLGPIPCGPIPAGPAPCSPYYPPPRRPCIYTCPCQQRPPMPPPQCICPIPKPCPPQRICPPMPLPAPCPIPLPCPRPPPPRFIPCMPPPVVANCAIPPPSQVWH